MNFKYLFLFLLFISAVNTLSAQLEYSGSINLEAYYSNKEDLPFWFYSNQQGRISEETNVAGWITGKMNYDFSANSSIEIGAGILYQDAFKDEVFIDELYVNFNYKWLQVIAGSKQKKELYDGLSASNENILWSLNARPIPGIQFKTNRPIYLDSNQKFGFEASWNEYYMGDNPGAKNVRLHHKKIQILYNFRKGWSFKTGIQHFVQWGGNSTRFGVQPQGFSDYLKIISGRAGGNNASIPDQDNALGNHLGSWELSVIKSYADYELSFIFNNLFEDGSGSRLANFPDGRYGLFIKAQNQDQLLNAFMYELYYTKEQSQTGPHLYDNYFNSGIYASGWTYKGRVLGTPFFTYDPDVNYIVNNKFVTHHIGIGGQLSIASQELPFKVMLSYARNEGTYGSSLILPEIDENVLNFYSKWRLLTLPVVLSMDIGFEFNSRNEPIFATGISLSKNF